VNKGSTSASAPAKTPEKDQDTPERGQGIIARTQELIKTGMGWSKAMEQARQETEARR
jgi:hypothetical protein